MQNMLKNIIYLNSPLVEITPFVFSNRLYLLENWRKMWDHPIELKDYPKNIKTKYITKDMARIRDVEADKIICVPMVGFGFCSAFVDGGRVYMFGAKFDNDKRWDSKEIWMCYSDDLIIWSHPVCVLRAGSNESFFNVNVCRHLNNKDYVLLVETDDPQWPKFTFRFFTSGNLTDWRPVENGIYGKDKYVGGPAIYNINGFYYVCYLDEAKDGWRTRLTRSTNLIDWQDAPQNKPVVEFNPENGCHRLRGGGFKENNASDLELCEFEGKTLLYFTGGDQFVCGNLQRCEYHGEMRDFFEMFYL